MDNGVVIWLIHSDANTRLSRPSMQAISILHAERLFTVNADASKLLISWLFGEVSQWNIAPSNTSAITGLNLKKKVRRR